MTENSPTAMSIFGYRDPRMRQTTVCGTAVMVVAPPVAAVSKIFSKLVEGKGMTPQEIEQAVKAGDVSKVMDAIPDIFIACVREVANPKQHVFNDDPETRKLLADLPFEDALNVFNIAMELMGQDKTALAQEIKN